MFDDNGCFNRNKTNSLGWENGGQEIRSASQQQQWSLLQLLLCQQPSQMPFLLPQTLL